MAPNARLFHLALAACIQASGVAWADCARLVISADPNYPPLHWYDGKTLKGASIDIARRIATDLGVPYEVRFVGPFPRVLHLAEQGDIDLIATLKKTPEREIFLAFPTTPALPNPVAVFALQGHKFAYRRKEDLISLRGGITRGNRFGEGFDDFLSARLTVEEADSPENNFRKLEAERIDYYITGYYTGMAFLLKSDAERKFTALRPYLTDTPNYFGFSRRSKCAELLGAFDARLIQLKKSGAIDQIIKQNLQSWKDNPVVADQ